MNWTLIIFFGFYPIWGLLELRITEFSSRVKNPNFGNYPSTNLENIIKKKINKKQMILRLKKIYENFILNLNICQSDKIL